MAGDRGATLGECGGLGGDMRFLLIVEMMKSSNMQIEGQKPCFDVLFTSK